MIADGNGFCTVRVPRHIDYSAAGRGSAPGSRPARRNFRNSFARQFVKALSTSASPELESAAARSLSDQGTSAFGHGPVGFIPGDGDVIRHLRHCAARAGAAGEQGESKGSS